MANGTVAGNNDTSNTEKLKLIGYVRVSSKNKNDHEPSAKEQIKEIRAWAKKHGHAILAIGSDEGISGTIEEREALTQALAILHRGKADGIVFAHIDRLSRQLTVQEAILAQCWDAGGRAFATDTGEILADDPADPMRKAMRQMMGVFAELERGMIRARMDRGKRAARADGRYVGGFVPLGQRVEAGKLVDDQDSQQAIERMRELRDSGQSLRQIVAILSAEGHQTARGGQWQPSTVSRVLARLSVADSATG